MAAKDFYIGQRVSLSECGRKHFALSRSAVWSGGVVRRVQKNGFIQIVLHGNKTPTVTHPSLWEPDAARLADTETP